MNISICGMKNVVVVWLLCFWCTLVRADLVSDFAPLGQLILTNLPSAPFPHPDRKKGYTYHDKFFPAAPHYSDSTVAIFVPRDFTPKRKTDFIVHFHGWGNDVTNVFRFYKTAEQLVESKRNAILVVPQGPWRASDSFGGKLEDENGFKIFMTDVVAILTGQAVLRTPDIGQIILSGHSGGYHVMSSIVEHGGLNEKIKELWLFDALYGQTPKYMNWFDNYHGKIIDIYTEHGGTKEETEKLMNDLSARKVKFVSRKESEVQPKDLRKNKLVFIYTELPHNEVMHVHDTFREFLTASSFAETPHQKR